MANRLRFTKTSLEKLPLPSGNTRKTYYDQDISKLALRVTAAGTKSFYVVKRVAGEMIWYKLGTFPELTVEQARKAAEVTLGSFANENNPAAVRRSVKGMPTLNEFFIEYGERHGIKKLAWHDDQQRFRDYLRAPIGARKLSLITREMIGRILTDMDIQGKAGATVNNVRALASGIFGKAIEWGYIKDNPVRGIKTRKAVKRDRFMSANELPRFFASVAEELNTTVRDYFLIALLTGARRSNVVAMRWSEIDFTECVWRIALTKNGDPQNVTLSPEAVTLLEKRKVFNQESAEPSAFVFPGNGATGHLVEPRKGWKRIFDRDEITQLNLLITKAGGTLFPATTALEDDDSKGDSLESTLNRARTLAVDLGIDIKDVRIPDLRIHDLRRTLGSWQAKTGASLAIIGKSLNHKNQSTTAIYARLDLDPVRAAVNTATTAMMEAGGVRINSNTNTGN
jgi:integrase